ncbi:MAG: stalk domain-containing protein [Candidatus Cryosericum sp.]
MKRGSLSVAFAAFLVCSVLSSAFCGTVASAASGTTLSLVPATGAFATGGGDLSVAVGINTVGQVVNAVRAYVKFDAAKLEVVRIDAASSRFPMQWPTTFDNTAGTIDINRTCLGGETFDGTGLVASIIFRARAAGTATVELILARSMVMRVSDYTNVLAAVGPATYAIAATPPGVRLSKSSVSVTERGAGDTYTIALKAPPTADVVITATPDARVRVSPAVLTFTPGDWASPQTVTVTAVDDAIAEGTHVGTIVHTVASTDADYRGMTVGSVTAVVQDNEFVLNVTARPSSGGSVTRKPDQASYPVGTVVALTAVPAPGNVFAGWRGGASGTATTATVTMNADTAVAAAFTRDTISVLKLVIDKYWMQRDGAIVRLDVAPIIRNSRAFLPVRAIAEATGSSVSWDARTRKVTVKRKDRTVELWIGKNIARVNGTAKNIDADDYRVVPIIMNARTLLPLRFVAESVGLDVHWSDAARMVTITWRP